MTDVSIVQAFCSYISSFVVHDVAATTVAPTIATGVTLPTPQNVAAATVAPTISASSNIVLPTPQNVAAATVAPTVKTHTAADDCTIPFLLTVGGPTPTYYPVKSKEYVRLDARTFIHFYNDSGVNDAIVYRALEAYAPGAACHVAILPAGTELILGPFDLSTYGLVLVVTHTSITDVTMAALTTPCHESAGIYIDDIDFSNKLVPNTVSVIDQLDGRNTLSFATRHLTDSDAGEVGQPVELWDADTTQLFAGIITDRQRNQIGDVDGYEYAYKCADYSTLATRHLIGWNYEDMSTDDIVIHINQYFMAGEGVIAAKVAGGGHVEPGITLDKAVFNYCTVASALDQIAEQNGYSWYIDYNKELHFFERTTNVAPFELTDTDCHYITLDAMESAAEYRNRQWIQGGNQLSEPRTETFLGDGKLTSFKLMYQVAKVPTITVNGVTQTTGIQSVDEDKDWYWSDNSDTITQAQKVEPYKKFSSIEYDFSDNADATLKNRSEAGVGMGATAYENCYRPLSTGAGSWRFTKAADYIKIPKNVVIDNLQQMTMEWIFWWGVTTTDPRLFEKGDFIVYINNTTNSVSIWRYGIGGGYIAYTTPANTITVGHYYHVQIVWDSTTIGNLPTIYINGAKQTVTATTTGTVTAFISDSSYDAYIGNRAAYDRYFNGSFLLFRLFRSSVIPPLSYPDPETLTTGLLTEEQLRQNYLAERWRYSHTSQGDILEQDQKLSVTYQYNFPLLDVVDDAPAQATQAALEGTGTGVYETIENDGTLDDTSWALDKATRLLAKYGIIPEVVKFTTHTSGLKAGQLLTIDLPDLDLDDDYLITEVSTADESFVQYTYDVTAASGESLGGWTKFFMDEAAKGRTFKINEGQTLLLLTRSLESLTVTDSLSQTNGTPDHLVAGVSGNAAIGPVQGITGDGTNYFGFDTTAIRKYDLAWNLVASNTNAGTDVGCTHIGDGFCYGGHLYAACVTITATSPLTITAARIGKWNASDLSFDSYVDIIAEGFDPSGCCLDSVNNVLWVSCYYAGNALYKYDFTTNAYLGAITPNPPIPYVQGIDYYMGGLYVSSNISIGTGGRVVRMATSGIERSVVIPLTTTYGEFEGVYVNTSSLWLLTQSAGGHVYLMSWSPTTLHSKVGFSECTS